MNNPADPNLEVVLERSFSIGVPAGSRAAIDHQIRAAMARESARRATLADSRPMRARRLLVGVAAAVLLTGTVAAGGTLLGQLVAGAPLLEDVWDRSTDIGRSATDSGYTIVLERAAADPERVWVALTVEAVSGTGADPGEMQVTDANGVVFGGGTGAGTGDVDGVSAMIFGFNVPTGVTPRGPFTLQVTSLTTTAGETRGDWVFTFDVPLTPAASRAARSATPRPHTP